MKTLLLLMGFWGATTYANLVFVDLDCIAKGNQYSLQRKDGASLGDPMSEDQCNESRDANREGVVCALFAAQWYPTIIASIKKLGKGSSFSDCITASKAANADVACALTESGTRAWKPVHSTTGNIFGRFGTSLSDCAELTKNASTGVVCTNTGTYDFKGRKPTIVDDKAYSDANLLGASGQQAYCTKSTREAVEGTVCACNGNFCGNDSWILYDTSTRKVIGRTTNLDSCIASGTF